MFMLEYGIAHNVAMAIGWLMGFTILGGLIYFAITIRGANEESPKW
jgi:hypothetical protein